MNEKYKNDDWLRYEYITLKKSAYKIARENGLHTSTITRRMKRFNIKKRDKVILGEITYRNKEWLEYQYIDLKKSSVKIAEENDSSYDTILRWLRKHGIKIRTASEACSGELHHEWKGGIQNNGKNHLKIYSPLHPNAHKNSVYKHRLIMEEYLGRYLTDKEVVHHINGNGLDNRIENLKLFSNGGEHTKFHHELRRNK